MWGSLPTTTTQAYPNFRRRDGILFINRIYPERRAQPVPFHLILCRTRQSGDSVKNLGQIRRCQREGVAPLKHI